MTPSSAATTSTTMSVTFAPRARMRVNASWPGVSRNTTRRVPDVDVVGADVLRDPARLARRHRGLADRVEERGLAVVDVAHDRDHGGAGDQVLRLRLDGLDLDDLLLERLDGRLVAELARDLDRQLGLEALVDGGHDPARDERLHHVARLDVRHLLRELLDGDALGEGDLAERPAVARLLLPLDDHGRARLGARGRASDGPHGPGRRPAERLPRPRHHARPRRHRVRRAGQRASGDGVRARGVRTDRPRRRDGPQGPRRHRAGHDTRRGQGRAGRRARRRLGRGRDRSRHRGLHHAGRGAREAEEGRWACTGPESRAPVTVVRTGPAGAAGGAGVGRTGAVTDGGV